MKRTARILGILAGVMLLCMGVFTTGASAQTQAVQDGMNYLYSVQNPDGSWGSASSTALKGTTTSAVLGTFEKQTWDRVHNQTGWKAKKERK